MEKTTTYPNTKFSLDVIQTAIEAYLELESVNSTDHTAHFIKLEVSTGLETWQFDSLEEFYSQYNKEHESSGVHVMTHGSGGNGSVYISANCRNNVYVSVKSPKKCEIDKIFNIFDKAFPKSQLPEPVKPNTQKPKIFIGHGQSPIWKDLKNHLQDHHNLKIEAYESGARAGHTIRDILEDMVLSSSFALLVLTAEDLQDDGNFRARQNVIHEAGLFQGRLGFNKAIMLVENGTETFSNIDGIQYIPFSKGNIKEVYGDVLATIRREFPDTY